MVGYIYRFFFYNHAKWLTIRALCLTGIYRFLIWRFPMSRLQPHFGIQGGESFRDELQGDNFEYTKQVSKTVNRVAARTPWESKCLVRALTAKHLLKKKNLESTLYLGVGKEDSQKLIAHAWLRCGNFNVTGGDGEEYAVVAKFR